MRSLLSLWIFDWRKLLAYSHRWMGIAGCLLFAAWFVSGIVMMYARMPGLADEERLARADPLEVSAIAVSPSEVAADYGLPADRVQVGMLQGRPVYRFGVRDRTIVFADTGEFFGGLDAAQAEAVARRYAPGYTGTLHLAATLTEDTPDQWTLQARNQMPLYRFELDDAEGTHLYVSDITGDVVVRTTRAERFWGYLGPVVHWLYFTPLRRNGRLWSELVIWSSLLGCVMCITGLVWGLWRFSPRRAYRLKRVQTLSPYAGWMKWHHVAGLVFGLVTLTWTYSGLLSMGPFNWFQSPPPSRTEREASSGGPLALEHLTIDSIKAAVAAVAPDFTPKELNSVQFRGEPYWGVRRAPTETEAARWMRVGLLPRASRPRLDHRYVSAVHPEQGPIRSFPRVDMEAIARAALPEAPVRDAVWLEQYDGYYYDPRGARPLPVLRVRYADARGTWLYFDPSQGGLAQRSTSVSRLRRWLYQGFHSLDFPFLYFHRPLWDIVVIVLSIGGTLLSITTFVPAWRRLMRHGRAFVGRVRGGGAVRSRAPSVSRGPSVPTAVSKRAAR
ncbi:MAG: PepSY domain-containing protein [Vicinamibacterales bacterium]